MRLSLLIIVLAVLAGCATSPPKHLDSACSIFKEKGGWYKDAKRASKRWGVPIATNMAFMYQESRFKAKAKPPRKWYLGFIPGPRPSTAYGYSQAKKETWKWYQRESGASGADRNDFDDAIDFIAWYNHITVKKHGVAATDSFNLYLAYHEGHGGFSRGSYRHKPWLVKVARKVDARARSYQAQINACEDKLNGPWWWPF